MTEATEQTDGLRLFHCLLVNLPTDTRLISLHLELKLYGQKGSTEEKSLCTDRRKKYRLDVTNAWKLTMANTEFCLHAGQCAK